jgi:hypothetical protein
MKILAIEKDIPGVKVEHFTPEILKQEAAKVWEYYENGIFREIYFIKEDNRAIIVLECQTSDSARTYLKDLPLMQSQLIDFDVYEITNYNGFKRLFG